MSFQNFICLTHRILRQKQVLSSICKSSQQEIHLFIYVPQFVLKDTTEKQVSVKTNTSAIRISNNALRDIKKMRM